MTGKGESKCLTTRSRKNTCQSEPLLIVLADFSPGERHFMPILQMKKLRFQEINRIPVPELLGIRDNGSRTPNGAWYTQKVMNKRSLLSLLVIFLCGRNKSFCCRGMATGGSLQLPVTLLLRQFCFPPTSLRSRRKIRNSPLSTHSPGMLTSPGRDCTQASLTVLNAFDQILEVEAGLVFGEWFEGGHFHHRPERSTQA